MRIHRDLQLGLTNFHLRLGRSLRSSSSSSRPVSRSGTSYDDVLLCGSLRFGVRSFLFAVLSACGEDSRNIFLGFSNATLSRSIDSPVGTNLADGQCCILISIFLSTYPPSELRLMSLPLLKTGQPTLHLGLCIQSSKECAALIADSYMPGRRDT